MRLWPRSLAGRLIAFLVLALIAAQLVAVLILAGERREAIRRVNEEQILQRTTALVLLLRDSPPALHERLIAAASLRRQAFWLSDDPALETGNATPLERQFAARLAAELGDAASDIRFTRSGVPGLRWRDRDDDDDDDDHDDGDHDDGDEDRWHDDMGGDHWRPAPPPGHPPAGYPPPRLGRDDHEHDRYWEHRGRRDWRGPVLVELSLRLADGRWLNGRTGWTLRRPGWASSALYSLGAMVLAVCLVVVLVVRRVTRPMNRLAAAADELGRGGAPDPVPEEGPEELRRTTRAFNRMQERLERFVRDRTHLLAAISHDLRTPITSLRLRAEFIEDPEVREKILETLDEMQRMAEETLAFAREDATREDTRTVDLSALLGSLCDDLADLGLEVTCQEAPRRPLPCRPTALKRALRNLIENAVAYGQRARVSLESEAETVRVLIEDDGPGIPEADFERVFEPFVRREESRSRETGGVGLGLAIARSIVRAHGGDIALANRAAGEGTGGGLRVTVSLPGGTTAGA